MLAEGCIILTNAAHKLAECRHFGALSKFVRAFVKVVNDWPAILPGCAAGHRGQPAPEQKVPPKDRIYIDGPDRPRCGLKESAGQGVVLSAATERAPKNPILWRDFCMASCAYAPERLFRVPLALFPAGQGAAHPGCRRGRRRAARRAVGPNIKQCVLCIKPRSAMRGCAEGRKALRLMREALLYHRFTSKKWSITKPRHGDTLSGKYLPLIRYLSPLNSKYE